MRFWLDVRLATDAGETVQRKRLSGEMHADDFEVLGQQLLESLEGLPCTYRCEQDRTQVGAGPPLAAG